MEAEAQVAHAQGNSPVLISVPHGGSFRGDAKEYETRVGSADVRAFCVDPDKDSLELAAEISARFFTATGLRPYVVGALLHRSKCDFNREPAHAYPPGCAASAASYKRYHSLLARAAEECTQRFGRCLVLDLHGQSHDPVTELGYLLPRSVLDASSDADLDRLPLKHSSLSALLSPFSNYSTLTSTPSSSTADPTADGSGAPHQQELPVSLSQLVRGDCSFGAFLVARGFLSCPSPLLPSPSVQPLCTVATSRDGLSVPAGPHATHHPHAPRQARHCGCCAGCCDALLARCCAKHTFYSGGHITRTFGRLSGVVAIQAETPLLLRESPHFRRAFAKAMALSLADFLVRHRFMPQIDPLLAAPLLHHAARLSS
ncbi:MAG: hypothetical protein Q8P67_07425, partial [archaeon]|nr:hypothetical protein [archaeon]